MLQNRVGISRDDPYGVGFVNRADDASDSTVVDGGKSAFYAVKQESSSPLDVVPHNGHDSHEVDEDVHLDLAHQMYKSGSYKQALDHSSVVYNQNPFRTDNLLLLGTIYYQVVGLGKSGKATARLALARGASVVGMDKNKSLSLLEGKHVMSELDFAAEVLPKSVKILAVTGTNGKSILATFAGQILDHFGINTFMGGNLGNPLFEAAFQHLRSPAQEC